MGNAGLRESPLPGRPVWCRHRRDQRARA